MVVRPTVGRQMLTKMLTLWISIRLLRCCIVKIFLFHTFENQTISPKVFTVHIFPLFLFNMKQLVRNLAYLLNNDRLCVKTICQDCRLSIYFTEFYSTKVGPTKRTFSYCLNLNQSHSLDFLNKKKCFEGLEFMEPRM